MVHSIPIQVITETLYIFMCVCVCVCLHKNKNMSTCISNRSSKTTGEGTADLISIIKDPCCKSEKLHPFNHAHRQHHQGLLQCGKVFQKGTSEWQEQVSEAAPWAVSIMNPHKHSFRVTVAAERCSLWLATLLK